MKLTLRALSTLLLILVLASCNNNNAKTPGKEVAATAAPDSVKASPTKAIADASVKTDAHNQLNDVALYLAGMKTDSNVAIPAKLQNFSFYRTYSDTINKGFNNMEANRLKQMRCWAKTELADELAHPKTVFYPFSGPDILHCVQFYPDADQYIMIALEKYGSLPVMDKMDSAKTHNTLNSIQKSLEDIFGKSYFITRKMLRDVSNRWNGFTPLASVFLVRSGYAILDVQYKHLEEDGKTEKAIPQDSCGNRDNDFVEIYFRKKGSEKIQKLVYFKINLCDDVYGGMASFKANTALQTYLGNMPECYTYVKSASYLMNYPSFSTIRNICLKKSKSILQDDTGIAFKYIEQTKWKSKLYGNYVKPVSDFKGVWQEDLNQAYKKDSSNVKQLPFSLGYHWGSQQAQNLMKFERR